MFFLFCLFVLVLFLGESWRERKMSNKINVTANVTGKKRNGIRFFKNKCENEKCKGMG